MNISNTGAGSRAKSAAASVLRARPQRVRRSLTLWQPWLEKVSNTCTAQRWKQLAWRGRCYSWGSMGGTLKTPAGLARPYIGTRGYHANLWVRAKQEQEHRGAEAKKDVPSKLKEWFREMDKESDERLRRMRDSADFAKTGGKRQARVVTEVLRLPALECVDLNEKPVELQKLVKGKITLACFGFQSSSDGMIAAFQSPFDIAFQDDDRFQFVEVNMCAHVTWQWSFFRNMMFRHMRSVTPPERHGLYLCHTVDEQTPLKELDMAGSRVVGYARLVDANGRIRWLAQGMVTKQEITDMISLAHSLATNNDSDARTLAEIESQNFNKHENRPNSHTSKGRRKKRSSK